MAENPFFNRVDERNGSVIMDISDTTATADDVLTGKKFYSASGAPATGTLVPGTITEVQANGTSVATSGIANIPAASTSGYGVTKLNNTTSSTSTSEAATAAVVKQINDDFINRLGTVFSLYNGGFTSGSPGYLDDVVSLPTSGMKCFVFMWYNGYAFADDASLYFIQKGEGSHNFYGQLIIKEGQRSGAPRMATDGAISKNGGAVNDYVVRVLVIRVL